MNPEEKVEFYLNNQEQLYKEWYVEQYKHGAGLGSGEPRGKIEDIKVAFTKWFADNKSELQNKICPHVKDIQNNKFAWDTIKSLIKLIKFLPCVGPVLETAILLFVNGIENLCKSYDIE